MNSSLKHFKFPDAGIPHEWEYNFESTINSPDLSSWFQYNFNWSLYSALAYVLAVFVGQKYMESKAKFELRKPMMIWSLVLAMFSVLGCVRLVTIFAHLYNSDGVRGVICTPSFQTRGPIIRFWGPLFIISKVVEFVDTMFIVLRKQRLIFLHWYHHATVSVYCWWMYGEQLPGGVVFMTVNIFVHSVMYTYYALRAAGVRIPKKIAVSITSIQIVQMVVGSVTMYLVHLWMNDQDCRSNKTHIFMGTAMYLSYFVLFVDFFVKAYMKKRHSAAAASGKNISENAKTTEKLQHEVNSNTTLVRRKTKQQNS